MASTYVNHLRLEEIADGEQSGTWGATTNTNLELIGQAFAWGTRAIANDSTDNITIADGASDADRSLALKLTGGGQACTVTLLPNTSSKVWIMNNATSYTLTFTCGSGANVAIEAGETKVIATDGLGSGGVVYDLLTAVNLAGTTKTAALTNAGALSNQGTLTVGVDDTGYDVQFFGATSGKSWLWDQSADKVIAVSDLQQTGTLTVGVDDTGHDVKFFGATSGAYMLWDESADALLISGSSVKVAGKESIYVPAGAMYPNTTAGCSALTQVELSNGPELKCLDFAADADDFAQFTVAFPKSWNEGTVTFQAFWTVTGTDTGTVAWALQGVGFADNADQNSGDGFGDIVVATAKAFSGTTQDMTVSAESGAVTIRGAAVDTLTYFQIFRDISVGTTNTQAARLLGVKIFFTTDAANDA
jgi:hypothetical protein